MKFFLLKNACWKITLKRRELRLFGHFKNEHNSVVNFVKVVEDSLCLPVASALVERVSFLMNNAWTDNRRLKEATVKGIMMCKINIGLSCEEFYPKIEDKKEVLNSLLVKQTRIWPVFYYIS